MRIILTGKDELEITDRDSTFIPIEIIFQDDKPTVSFYAELILELRRCGGEYRMFQFNGTDEYNSFDFGHFTNEEIVWTNIRLS